MYICIYINIIIYDQSAKQWVFGCLFPIGFSSLRIPQVRQRAEEAMTNFTDPFGHSKFAIKIFARGAR